VVSFLRLRWASGGREQVRKAMNGRGGVLLSGVARSGASLGCDVGEGDHLGPWWKVGPTRDGKHYLY
jgi:hypothetical protein